MCRTSIDGRRFRAPGGGAPARDAWAALAGGLRAPARLSQQRHLHLGGRPQLPDGGARVARRAARGHRRAAALRASMSGHRAWLDADDAIPTLARRASRACSTTCAARARLSRSRTRTGRSRFAVARWLKGEAQPRLPDFLRLIEAPRCGCSTSSRAWSIPSCAAERRRRLPRPRSDAPRRLRRALVARVPARAGARATTGAARARARLARAAPGLSRQEEQRASSCCCRAVRSVRDAGRYAPRGSRTVDTRRDPEAAQRLRVFWSRAGAERMRASERQQRLRLQPVRHLARRSAAPARAAARVLPPDARDHRRVRARSRRWCSPTCS